MRLEDKQDFARLWAYVVIAIAALFVGFFLGQLGRGSSGGSRVDWPHAVR